MVAWLFSGEVVALARTLALLAALAGGAALAQEQAVGSFQFVPGVVVDAARRQAFVMSPTGAVVALDLARGQELWRTQEAAKPLALEGGILVAQADQGVPGSELQIVALDTRAAGRPVFSRPVSLPPGVRPGIDQTPRTSFEVLARPAGGEVTVSWQYVQRPLRGAPLGGRRALLGEGEPDAGAMPAAPAGGGDRRVTAGAFRIELPTGDLSPVPPGAAPPAVFAAGPRTVELAGTARLAGLPEPQFLSADGRHVATSELVSDDTVLDKYRWTVFERDTGRHLGKLRTISSVAPFFVMDFTAVLEVPPHGRVTQGGLVEEPRQLQALDLETGVVLWRQPVRDTAPRTAPPP